MNQWALFQGVEPDRFQMETPARPKEAIHHYIAEQGIPTPDLYATIEEAQAALNTGKSVIVRSEHPDEYAGPSGRGHSGIVLPRPGAFDKLADLAGRPDYYGAMYEYAVTAGLDPELYVSRASVSFWEYVPGTNATVVADDAVEGRYWVFGASDTADNDGRRSEGAIVEFDGTVFRSSDSSEDTLLNGQYAALIARYNEVRSLDKFNSDHCPIIEMQISDADNQIYFLQYHRSRDARHSDARLDHKDFDAGDGWLRGVARGVYLGDKALKLALWYPSNPEVGYKPGIVVPEDGFLGNNMAFEDIHERDARQRTLDIIPKYFADAAPSVAQGHGHRTRWFKPELSVLLPPPAISGIVSREMLEQAAVFSEAEGVTVGISCEAVSDGQNAFVRPVPELIQI